MKKLCNEHSRSKVSTLEKLKRIELTMENLTKDLDLLPQEKVKIAQRAGISSYPKFCPLSF